MKYKGSMLLENKVLEQFKTGELVFEKDGVFAFFAQAFFRKRP